MKNLFKALAAFQQQVPIIHKGTEGYGYSYADLPAILEIINPLMAEHGLGFTQLINGNELKTILFHVESGETLESSISLIEGVQLSKMNPFQVLGSQITYLRRYAISAILGLVTDKDTDASGQVEKVKMPDDVFQKVLLKFNQRDYGKFKGPGEMLTEIQKKYILTESQIKQIYDEN